MYSNTGKLIISLNVELLWGVLDLKTAKNYEKNILGVWEAIPEILKLFDNYNIRGTFAVVGLLFSNNKEDVKNYLPKVKPNYKEKKISPYLSSLSPFKLDKYKDELYFAESLIDMIKSKKQHEIASHTFSHYYCLEEGQSIEAYKADLEAAISIAKSENISIKSLVFPRNQFTKEHLKVLTDLGINSYRGNESAWYYQPVSSNGDKNHLLRLTRLLDNYINLSGHNCYSSEDIKKEAPYNLASSKFLRPHSSKLKPFDSFKFKRIKNSMTYAAKNKKIYHLWWHPHNFGVNLNENLNFLEKILKHYKYLNEEYGFQSTTMNDFSNELETT